MQSVIYYLEEPEFQYSSHCLKLRMVQGCIYTYTHSDGTICCSALKRHTSALRQCLFERTAIMGIIKILSAPKTIR